MSKYYNTNKIQKALEFAYKVHQTDQFQTRKGKQVPYIFHPLAVANILERVGATQNQKIAGILHDTIEDCIPYGSVTKEIIAEKFGSTVARIVNDLTEQDKNLPWEIRKKEALEHIPKMKNGSLLVKSADILHNFTDQLEDYEVNGEKMFKNFNAPKSKQLESYKKFIVEIKKAWPKNPLLPPLQNQLNKAIKIWSS